MFLMDHEFEVGSHFEGEFWVTVTYQGLTRYHAPYMVAKLGDLTGVIEACCWAGRYHGPENLSTSDVVSVSGVLGYYNGHWQVHVEHADLVDKSEINPALLISADLCPRQDLLEKLARVVGALSSPPLQRFVRSVLSDDNIIRRFVLVPASVKNHHCYPAGTLEHSLECVDVVRGLPGLTRDERDIVTVAALYHDVGKIMTNKESGLTPKGFWMHHNALTLEILGEHLKKLDHDWPEAGYVLRHIWSALHKGPTQPKSSLVGVVQYADQYSAERNQEKAAFANQPEWKTAAHDSNGNLRRRLRKAA